jgi:hypothetical protein
MKHLPYILLLFTLFSDPANAYQLPDTGQTKCYEAVSPYAEIPCTGTGQDGAYNINTLSYTDNGNGTVTDNNTGLLWQKCSVGQNNDVACSGTAETYNWFQASGTYDAAYNPSTQNVCGALTLGGYANWHLPTKKELISIVNYGIPVSEPTITSAFFPNTVAYYYWSSTTVAATFSPDEEWLVHFGSGTTLGTGKTEKFHVRCVSGEQPVAVLLNNGNGTVTETKTGLIWQQGETDSKTWVHALSYCEGLSLGGHSDWRLPNVRELESLFDDTRDNPAIDTSFFPDASVSFYWSSTTITSKPSGAWHVAFGGSGSPIKYSTHRVRCVRGGQSYLVIGNAGVANATVFLSGAAITTTTRGVDGSYSFSGLANGSYTVTPTLAVYTFTPTSQNVTVNNADVSVPAFTATPITYQLDVTLAGTGTININPPGTLCSSETCTNTYPPTTPVDLTASIDNLFFITWGGACSGTNPLCSITMDSNKTVSATLTPADRARISTTGYPTLNAAYSAAPSTGVTTILTLDAVLNESLTVNKLLNIIGGYKAVYSGRTGNPTVLQGILTIGTGSLAVDGLAVK